MAAPEHRPDRPLMVYDGDCSFCRLWIDYWKHLTGDRIEYAPFQEVASHYPQIPLENFQSAVQLIQPDGKVVSAARAVFTTLAYTPGRRWLLWLYEKFPGFTPVTEWAYRLIAAHRDFFYKATRLLWGTPLEPPTYSLVTWLFLRALGLIYFIAFASFGAQVTGLIGANGILPAGDFLQAVQQYFGPRSYALAPTLFWLNASDAFLQVVCIAGAALGLLLMLGFARKPVLILLYVLYLSLVTTGQVFMSFQWDALLLETGFLAIFLSPASSIVVWLLRWLLFRLMFSSGAVKLLSGDPAWRNLTALNFHFATQPLPNVIAWVMYQLPEWFHQLAVVVTFAVELIIPFLIFAPRHLRFFAGAAMVFLQTLIFLTGNYTFFNLLAVALCLMLLDDAAVRRSRFMPRRLIEHIRKSSGEHPRSRFGRYGVAFVAGVIFIVSAFQLASMFSVQTPELIDTIASWIEPFRIVNTYGLFAVMTTSRPEIIVEGSNDGQTWLEYEFKYKPGDVRRPPLWVEPLQPRLDWQMWFAALGTARQNPWLVNFAVRLLQGSPQVLALLDKNPFPAAPPRYIRALSYDYRFTDLAGHAAGGAWWQRDPISEYLPAIALQ